MAVTAADYRGHEGERLALGALPEIVEVHYPVRGSRSRRRRPIANTTTAAAAGSSSSAAYRGRPRNLVRDSAEVVVVAKGLEEPHAAAQAAIALAAKRLVFMSDVPGLLRDPSDATSLISHLDVAEVDKLKQAGIIASGMIPKVDSATAAIDAGVDKVSFVDGRINHAVLLEIFTDEGVGTEIVK